MAQSPRCLATRAHCCLTKSISSGQNYLVEPACRTRESDPAGENTQNQYGRCSLILRVVRSNAFILFLRKTTLLRLES